METWLEGKLRIVTLGPASARVFLWSDYGKDGLKHEHFVGEEADEMVAAIRTTVQAKRSEFQRRAA